MTVAKFNVFSGGGKFNGKSEATVTIDRANNFFAVRPKRMHKTYEMRLEDVAELVLWRCLAAELSEKKRLKKEKKKMGRK